MLRVIFDGAEVVKVIVVNAKTYDGVTTYDVHCTEGRADEFPAWEVFHEGRLVIEGLASGRVDAHATFRGRALSRGYHGPWYHFIVNATP